MPVGRPPPDAHPHRLHLAQLLAPELQDGLFVFDGIGEFFQIAGDEVRHGLVAQVVDVALLQGGFGLSRPGGGCALDGEHLGHRLMPLPPDFCPPLISNLANACHSPALSLIRLPVRTNCARG